MGGGGIRPEQSKVQGILDMAVPTTMKEVGSFLGMLGYYQRFIPNFATKAEPLTNQGFTGESQLD